MVRVFNVPECYEYHGSMLTLDEIAELENISVDQAREFVENRPEPGLPPKLSPQAVLKKELDALLVLLAEVNELDDESDREAWPGARDLPFSLDLRCQAWIAKHGPATLEQVGAVYGRTRERMRQLEQDAMSSFLINARKMGLEDKVHAELKNLAQLRDARGESEEE